MLIVRIMLTFNGIYNCFYVINKAYLFSQIEKKIAKIW